MYAVLDGIFDDDDRINLTVTPEGLAALNAHNTGDKTDG